MADAVTIREYTFSDIPRVYMAVQESLGEVSRWLSDLNADLTTEKIRSYIEKDSQNREEKSSFDYAIVDSETDAILGGCGLNSISQRHRFGNLYYWVRTSATGRGVATQATLQLASFGFTHVELNRIEIVVAVENSASARVAQKVGAQREGVLRNRLCVGDQIQDAYMYSLTPSDIVATQRRQ